MTILTAGPNFNMANVVISGTDIDRTVISPATVTFNITNDDVAVEDDETYLVTLIPSNPSVFVERRMAQIVILDDVDSKFCSYLEFCMSLASRVNLPSHVSTLYT